MKQKVNDFTVVFSESSIYPAGTKDVNQTSSVLTINPEVLSRRQRNLTVKDR